MARAISLLTAALVLTTVVAMPSLHDDSSEHWVEDEQTTISTLPEQGPKLLEDWIEDTEEDDDDDDADDDGDVKKTPTDGVPAGRNKGKKHSSGMHGNSLCTCYILRLALLSLVDGVVTLDYRPLEKRCFSFGTGDSLLTWEAAGKAPKVTPVIFRCFVLR